MDIAFSHLFTSFHIIYRLGIAVAFACCNGLFSGCAILHLYWWVGAMTGPVLWLSLTQSGQVGCARIFEGNEILGNVVPLCATNMLYPFVICDVCVCVPCLPFVGEIYAHTCTGSVSVNIWLLMSYGRNLQLSMERISCRDPEIFIDSLAHSAAHTAANCPDIVVGWDVLSDSRNDMKHIDATSTIYQGCTISTAMTIRCGILTFIYLHIYLFVHLFTCVSMYLPIDLFYGKLSLGLFFLWNPWFLRPCPCDGMLLSSKVCWDHSRDGSEVTASHVGSLPGVATWPGEMWGTQSARWFRPKMRVAVDLFWVGTTWNQKNSAPHSV